MTSIQLTVNGMSCGHCQMAVTKALKSLTGVADVKVDLTSKTATIQYNPEQVSVDALKAAVVDAGYEVG